MSHAITASLASTLEKLRTDRDERDSGFTLIELLVVVVIIGILVAIAIPLYLNYQNGAKNKSAESDVRGAISAAEQFYSSNGNVYPDTASGTASFDLTSATITGVTAQKVVVGGGNSVGFVNNTAATGGYLVCGFNDAGKHAFTYDSSKGGAVQDLGVKTLDLKTCTAK